MSSVVYIDLAAISQNVERILSLCTEHNVSVTAVTKGVLADEKIVRVLMESGIKEIGDSRLKNLLKIRKLNENIYLNLIRPPGFNEIEEAVNLVDCSFVSEIETIKKLSYSCSKKNIVHEVMLLIDLGDRREGFLPYEIDEISKQISRITNIKVRGVATNLGCMCGVCYTPDKMNQLCNIAHIVESNLGYELEVISGGSTNALNILYDGKMNTGINNLRIGTAFLLGDSQIGLKIPGLNKETFVLEAEIIECRRKPSKPDGELAMDAFGKVHDIQGNEERIRAILSIGRQDVLPEALKPKDKNVKLIGASSDHTIFDITDSRNRYSVGDKLRFNLNYGALLFLMNSDYIKKIYIE